MCTLIFLSCSLTLALGLRADWNEILNETNVIRTCRTERDSCHNSTSPSPSEEINLTDLWTFNCFCDADCWRHGDCCLDKAIALQAHFESPPELSYWGCEIITASETLDHVYMITSCPYSWPEDDIRKKCERHENKITIYTYDLDYPVVSRATNTVYANMFCARCHRDTQLENMKAQVDCNKPADECVTALVNASYIPGLRLWGKHDGFRAWFHMPQLLAKSEFRLKRRIRMCRPTVDQCDPEWQANSTEAEKCNAFASFITEIPRTPYEIFDPEFITVFKNPFCAICNNVELLNNQNCKMQGFSQNGVLNFEMKGSFSLLLDFNSQDDGTHVGTVRRCPIDQIFDPLHNKCIDLPCGQLFDAVEGVCVAKFDVMLDLDHNLTLLNDSCSKLIRVSSEFIKLANGSVVITSSDQIYHLGQYEVQDDDSILICSEDDFQMTSKFSAMQSTLSLVVLLISVFFLGCHISITGTFSKLRNLPGKNLLSLSVMLLCGQVLFFGVTRIKPGGFCEFIAVMMHFCFLSSFFWMNVMAVDICRTFTVLHYHSSASDKNYKQYATYAWGFSALIVVCSIIVDNSNLFPTLRPSYGNVMCWISQRRGLLVFFAVPLGILLLENIIFFVLTARGICRTTDAMKSFQKTKQKIRFFLYMKLALIMGFTWVIGFVAALAEMDVLWYGFIILNGLQGTFIFFAFSFKIKVLILIKEKYFTKKPVQSSNGKAGNKGLGKSQATSMSNLNTTCTRVSNSNLNVNVV